MARETPLQRDLHLQELICAGDTKGAREYYCSTVIDRPLSRALGYACRYAGPELVRLLISGGATFDYNRHSVMRETNGIGGTGVYADVLERYMYLLDTAISTHRDCNKLIAQDEVSTRVRGAAYNGVIKELVDNAADIGFDPSMLLFLGLAFNEQPVLNALVQAGVTELSGYVRRLFADESVGRKTDQGTVLLDIFRQSIVENMLRLYGRDLESFLETMERIVGGPVRFRNGSESSGLPTFSERDTLSLLRHTTLARHSRKSDLMRLAIENQQETVFAWMLDQGWVRSWKTYEDLRAYIEGCSGAEPLMGLLLEHQRTGRIRRPRQQSMNPFSAVSLRKVWSVRTLPDGTLEITSYKGYENEDMTIATVPSAIGTHTVSGIDARTFQPWSGRTERINNARSILTEIRLPGTIKTIPERFMADHSRLKRVALGEGTTEIDKRAFEYCRRLEEVVLPSTLQHVHEGAFSECRSLRKIVGGENISSVGERAFSGCPDLTDDTGTAFVGSKLVAMNPAKIPSASYVLDDQNVPAAVSLGMQLPLLTYVATVADGTVRLPRTIHPADDVVLGRFPQQADFVPTPLHWTCIAADDSTALLVTCDEIAAMYSSVLLERDDWYAWVWHWLNTVFRSKVFSPQERDEIIESDAGYIFLLSSEEVRDLMSSTFGYRYSTPTEYACVQGCRYALQDAADPWLTRDEDPLDVCIVSGESGLMHTVRRSGDSSYGYMLRGSERSLFLRPALRLRKSR